MLININKESRKVPTKPYKSRSQELIPLCQRIPVAELKQLAKVLEISTAVRELSANANGYSGYRSLFYSFHLCSHIYFIEKMYLIL